MNPARGCRWWSLTRPCALRVARSYALSPASAKSEKPATPLRAFHWGLIRHSPAQAVRAPNVARKEMRALDADEVKRLLSPTAETAIGALVMVAVHAGLRRSELPGLQ